MLSRMPSPSPVSSHLCCERLCDVARKASPHTAICQSLDDHEHVCGTAARKASDLSQGSQWWGFKW